jgi:hypothetical protein
VSRSAEIANMATRAERSNPDYDEFAAAFSTDQAAVTWHLLTVTGADGKAQSGENLPLQQEHFDRAAPNPSDAAAVRSATRAATSLIENGCEVGKLAEERHLDHEPADRIVYSALPRRNPTIPLSLEAVPRPTALLQSGPPISPDQAGKTAGSELITIFRRLRNPGAAPLSPPVTKLDAIFDRLRQPASGDACISPMRRPRPAGKS